MVNEISLIIRSISLVEFTLAVELTTHPLAFSLGTCSVLVDAMAIWDSILEHTLVLVAIESPMHSAMPHNLITVPFAFIQGVTSEPHLSLPMPQSLCPLSLIHAVVRPPILTLSMHLVVLKMSLILVSLHKEVHTIPIPFVLVPLADITRVVRPAHDSPSTPLVHIPSAIIDTSLFPCQLTQSISLASLHLALILRPFWVSVLLEFCRLADLVHVGVGIETDLVKVAFQKLFVFLIGVRMKIHFELAIFDRKILI